MEPQRPQSTRRRDLSLLVQSSFASVSSVPSVANAFVGISKNETATTGSHRAHREHREKLSMSLFVEPKSFSVSSVISVANAFVGGSNGNGNDLATEHTEITERSTRPLWLGLWSWGQLGAVAQSTATGCPYHRYATSIPPVRGPRTTATRTRANLGWPPTQQGPDAGSTGGGRRVNLARNRGQLGLEARSTWVDVGANLATRPRPSERFLSAARWAEDR